MKAFISLRDALARAYMDGEQIVNVATRCGMQEGSIPFHSTAKTTWETILREFEARPGTFERLREYVRHDDNLEIAELVDALLSEVRSPRAKFLLEGDDSDLNAEIFEIPRAKDAHLRETAGTVAAPLDCLAFPATPGNAWRRQFPENIAMRIGVDRTRLIAVVDGIDPDALLANLVELERILIAADPDGKFGRRKWVLAESRARSPELSSWDAIGTVWPVPHELSVDALAGAIRTGFPTGSAEDRVCALRAGNVFVAVLQKGQKFGQILDRTVEQASMAGPGIHVSGWSLRRYRQLEAALSEAEADDPALGELSLSGLERKAFSALHRSQNVMLREKALVELENLAPSLPPHLEALFDWVAKGKGKERDDEAFFVSAGNYALYAATLSGLVSGDFASPDARQRGAKIVRLSGSNRELGHVLAALPACSEVLEALMEGNPWCRAAVGLVTADELAGPSPPGLGYPLDQWRNDRPLVT